MTELLYVLLAIGVVVMALIMTWFAVRQHILDESPDDDAWLP